MGWRKTRKENGGDDDGFVEARFRCFGLSGLGVLGERFPGAARVALHPRLSYFGLSAHFGEKQWTESYGEWREERGERVGRRRAEGGGNAVFRSFGVLEFRSLGVECFIIFHHSPYMA